jgi:hypothetical protein
VSLSGITSGAANENQPLTITATSSNPQLIAASTASYLSPAATGTLTLAPVLNQTGAATITVTVNDGQLANNNTTRTFNVTLGSLPKISALIAQPVDARTLKISWNTDQSAICSVAYGLTASVSQVSSSTSGNSHSVTLTNLVPGTLYYLQARATTGGGTATAVATATTEPRRVYQWAAETGTLGATASIFSSMETENGQYVASSMQNNSGIAAFPLTVAKGPNYRMWARVKTSIGGGAIGALVDGGAEKALFVGDANPTGAWHWALVMDAANRTNAATFPLETGSHMFTMIGGLTAWWDEFVISNDPLWQPILPTTRPALTGVRTSASSATLTWSDPSGNATSVAIEYSTDGVNFHAFTSFGAGQNFVNLGGLSPQTYYFRMYTCNALDRTAYSNVAAALY